MQIRITTKSACQVLSISVSAFVSYPVHRMTKKLQNDHIT